MRRREFIVGALWRGSGGQRWAAEQRIEESWRSLPECWAPNEKTTQ
jgi:hypothetical protein